MSISCEGEVGEDAARTTLSFPASWAGAAHAAEWLKAAATGAHANAGEVYALQVCLEELLTNIIKNNAELLPDVSLELKVELTQFVLIVRDEGQAFDVASAVPHRASGPLEELEPGGLGLQLIQSFSSDLKYRRSGAWNEVTVAVQRSSTPHV